ncbi:putative Mg2+ and Co2+ transporter CorB [Beggiatoa alba B18LD]|uniref:Putative Mg2+ and Co2+ transporter CorB n=1 Tax=Beggiatoa alba B18LD TaxID=395493 RepID=I3CCZ7_9GAMM|nr:HlyC/CorC family transporter [Beggiatoa alba]EIJ41490.1 putative Mg2+ and Co2+ transporter CorB [Beggiatoa alba B18LD]
MTDIPLSVLFGTLALLILFSAFFSGSETSMMAINRYRLRHLAAKNHRGAQRVQTLLERPDRLIGVILLGNNFVNTFASSIATVIAIELMGEAGIPIAASVLTIIILIFGEVTPKTLAATYPERIAFPTSLLIKPLLTLLYPLVWATNMIGNAILAFFGFPTTDKNNYRLSREELRTVVHEAEGIIPKRHQQMLLSILDLEKASVEDIMVPRHEIVGIDLDDPIDVLIEQLSNIQHTHLPLYRESIDNVFGVVHIRTVVRLFRNKELTKESLEKIARDVYFIPDGTPLNTQLLNFQHHRQQVGLVVNEYGDIQGLVTIDDILEEIVGEFNTNPAAYSLSPSVHPQDDGSYLVDGSTSIRELNRALQWHLPTTGAKTLNGLILDYLEIFPEPGTSLRLEGHAIEVVQVTNNVIKTVKVYPLLHTTTKHPTP